MSPEGAEAEVTPHAINQAHSPFPNAPDQKGTTSLSSPLTAFQASVLVMSIDMKDLTVERSSTEETLSLHPLGG